ncbi:MAG: histidine kinase [Sphingomonas bacterium]|uniref:GAF domain-containing sensor histidine kinase n=1 Tax=Sphingomonas bacterium TaxID=1895847 RepID=UPI00262E1E4C|nr:GAF domain-containing sensor histidine kinase [Sphingomonas bacterium]MDB5703532.1 histidine kinase [Sphingomonas bacterium]
METGELIRPAAFKLDIAAIERIEAVPTILDVVCRTTGMGFAAVARVTEDRWIACSVRDGIAFGLKPGGELRIETTICSEIRESREPVVIDHVAEHPDFCGHHTPAMYGFQSYISMPILLPDGSFFGTLCAIDPSPARVNNPETIGMFKMFADLIAFHLDAQARIERSEAILLDERRTAELREQFIAVLGHDLRNPLASIDAGTHLLLRDPPPEKAVAVIGMMRSSVARMAALIDDVLDLARGRLGGGLALHRAPVALAPVLIQVIDELRASHPGQQVEAVIRLDTDVDCDGQRIAQLLSNLLGNAMTHGAADQPVVVHAATRGDVFELSVSNAGEEIAPAAIERLFQPFARGAIRPDQAGLGLGLYIASEIARAHGGSLSVASSPMQTRFTFLMPLG